MARAFLIGAGATRAQYPKAPLSADFLQRLRDENATIYSELAECAKDISLNERYGQKFDELNIEELVQMCQDLDPSVKNTFFDCLYKALYLLLAESTESTTDHIRSYIENGNIFGVGVRPLFFNLLNDPDFDPAKDFFITLNYDLCLEREILAMRRELFFGDGKWLHGIDLMSRDIIPVSREKGISVFHLHGALNWEIDDGTIIPHYGAILPQYIRSELNLCLVAPGQKIIGEYLKPIWDGARTRLFSDNPPISELVIIGCSLNPQDKELIQLIDSYVKGRGSEKVKVVYYAEEPEGSEFKNYQKIIGHKFKKYPHGFRLRGPEKGAIEFIFRK